MVAVKAEKGNTELEPEINAAMEWGWGARDSECTTTLPVLVLLLGWRLVLTSVGVVLPVNCGFAEPAEFCQGGRKCPVSLLCVTRGRLSRPTSGIYVSVRNPWPRVVRPFRGGV